MVEMYPLVLIGSMGLAATVVAPHVSAVASYALSSVRSIAGLALVIGRFNVLEVKTRGFKGPCVVDSSGIPAHPDNQTVIKERIYLDKTADILNDEVTLIDHAFTRPWTVTRKFKRQPKVA
jgi:hypothetical protein